MGWLKRIRERFFRTGNYANSQVTGESSEIEWLEKLNVPFFRSRKDAESYVARELSGIVPDGWVVRRYSDQQLSWTIEKKNREPGACVMLDYGIWITKGFDAVILTYGNETAGTFGLDHALHTALVIDSVILRKFSLRECLSFLFSNHKPNSWGAT